jgi:hypothetical protein
MTAATDQVVPGVASGFEYIASSDADCWLTCGGAAAVGAGPTNCTHRRAPHRPRHKGRCEADA